MEAGYIENLLFQNQKKGYEINHYLHTKYDGSRSEETKKISVYNFETKT